MENTGSPMDHNSDGFLEDLATHLQRELQNDGIAHDSATEKALRIAEKMQHHWGGQVIYVNQGKARTRADRDKKIVAEFTGNNHAELAQKHQLSTMRIRQILWRAQVTNHAKPLK